MSRELWSPDSRIQCHVSGGYRVWSGSKVCRSRDSGRSSRGSAAPRLSDSDSITPGNVALNPTQERAQEIATHTPTPHCSYTSVNSETIGRIIPKLTLVVASYMRLFYESYISTRAVEARFSDSVPRFRGYRVWSGSKVCRSRDSSRSSRGSATPRLSGSDSTYRKCGTESNTRARSGDRNAYSNTPLLIYECQF
jgi:hypothetical protein